MKKLLAILLVLVMCLSIFTACSSNETTTDSSSDTSASTTDSKTDAATTDESSVSEENSSLLCDEPTKLVVYCNWSESPSTEDDQLVHDKILELTNVDLVRVGSGDYYSNRATYLSSGEQIDLMLESCWWATDLITQGAYQDLTDLIETYAPNFFEKIDPSYHSFVQWNGAYYGIGGTNYMNLYGIWVNKTMLDEIGAEIPTTLEEFEDICYQLKENDSEAIPLLTNWMWLQRCFEGSFTEGFADWYDDSADQLKIDMEMPGYTTFATAVKTWYNDGIIPAFCEPGSYSDDQWKTALMTGKCAFVPYMIRNFSAIVDEIQTIHPDVEYVCIEALTGDAGQAGFEPRPSIPYFFAVPSSSENAELAVKFMNWLLTEEGSRLTKYGIEGVHYNVVDGYLVPTDAYDNYTKCYVLCDVFDVCTNLTTEPASDNEKLEAELLAAMGMSTNFAKNDAYGVNMNLASIPQDILDKQASDKTSLTETLAKYMWTDEVDLAAWEAAVVAYQTNNAEYTQQRTEIYKAALNQLGKTTEDIRAALTKD